MAAAVVDQVSKFINGQKDPLVSLVRKLVEAESPSAHPECHDSVRRILAGALLDVVFVLR